MILPDKNTSRKHGLAKVSNCPNPKLLLSLRNSSYDIEQAVEDISDNSIDGKADTIWVYIEKKTEQNPDVHTEIGRIIIADNGIGMTKEILDEAMKLGSDIDKNSSCDLGYFSMGLKTASMSIGTVLEVITKSKDSECWYAKQDIIEMCENGNFEKVLDISDEEDESEFKKYTHNSSSGTVVIISDIDNEQWVKTTGLSKSLLKHLGQTFRRFIVDGKIKIYVNEEEVLPIDPINDYEPTILGNEIIDVDGEKISFKISEIKDYGIIENKQESINMRNQGVYVMRNNREIMAAETLGLFNKHNDLNTLRVEMDFPGTLDRILSSNFTKSKIKLSQSVFDKVQDMFNPYLKQVKGHALERTRARKVESSVFIEKEQEIAKIITRKTPLLLTPEVEKEIREKGDPEELKRKKKDSEGNGSPRINLKRKRLSSLPSDKVRWGRKSLGEKGPLWEPSQEKDVTVIYWNEDNPYYISVIQPASPLVMQHIYYLVYSNAVAELRSHPDSDMQEIFSNIRYEMGRNLAVLMK